jgi:catalase
VEEDKVRGKPEKFAEHYTQATLFWNSQSDVERQHIIRAYHFELTKVQTVAVRERVVAQLRNVDDTLAQAVADGLGMSSLPKPLPRLMKQAAKPEVARSKALSLFARPGSEGIKTRRIAIFVAEGVAGAAAREIHSRLAAEGAVPRFVGIKLGPVQSKEGEAIQVEVSIETMPSALWDGMIVPGGSKATETLARDGCAMEFLKDQYRHCKTILLMGSASDLLAKAAIRADGPDSGLLRYDSPAVDGAVDAFVAALTQHRHFSRESDPPRI